MEEPVSRFWACFISFILPILGLIWTLPMKKARLWLVLIFWPILLGIFSYEAILIGTVINGIPEVYFMYKWTSKYNLDKFGYESKDEWKKANSTGRSPTGL